MLITEVNPASEFMAGSMPVRGATRTSGRSWFLANERRAWLSWLVQCSLRLAFIATFVRYVSVDMDFQLTGAGP